MLCYYQKSVCKCSQECNLRGKEERLRETERRERESIHIQNAHTDLQEHTDFAGSPLALRHSQRCSLPLPQSRLVEGEEHCSLRTGSIG